IFIAAGIAAGQVAQEFPIGNAEENDVDIVFVRRVRGEEIARRRRDRRDLLALDLGIDLEWLAVLLWLALGHQRREVLLAQPGAELTVEFVRRDVEGTLQGLVDAAAEGVAVFVDEIAEALPPVLLLDVREHGMSEA